MGALFVKAGCCPTCFDKKLREISPVIASQIPCPDRQLSEEIIKELKSCGIIATETTRGGLSFNVMSDDGEVPRKPRRLPSLVRNKVQPQGVNNATERTRLANERRQECLDKKAKAGKDYNTKRTAVLERREKKLKDRIRRTEEKLRKRTEGNSK